MQTLSSRCSGLLLLLMLALLLTACTTSAAPERLTSAPESAPPEDVVRAFYQTWISAEGNPINERIYDNTDYLTPDFIQRIDDRIVEQGGIAADPLVCAQNIPHGISTDPAHVEGNRASVTVHLHFGGSERHIIVRVIRDPAADIWSIDDLACGH